MAVVVELCAGLDVHKDSVVACVRVPGPLSRFTVPSEDFCGRPGEPVCRSIRLTPSFQTCLVFLDVDGGMARPEPRVSLTAAGPAQGPARRASH